MTPPKSVMRPLGSDTPSSENIPAGNVILPDSVGPAEVTQIFKTGRAAELSEEQLQRLLVVLGGVRIQAPINRALAANQAMALHALLMMRLAKRMSG